MAHDVDLVELEHAGWQALSAGNGGSYYSEHLAADAMMAFSFGVLDRDAAIEAMRQAPPWSAFEILDARVLRLTGDCGVVVYRANARRTGADPYSAMISSTFVRRDGRWMLAFHQQTPIEHAEGLSFQGAHRDSR
jgi:hypothetical protein